MGKQCTHTYTQKKPPPAASALYFAKLTLPLFPPFNPSVFPDPSRLRLLLSASVGFRDLAWRREKTVRASEANKEAGKSEQKKGRAGGERRARRREKRERNTNE